LIDGLFEFRQLVLEVSADRIHLGTRCVQFGSRDLSTGAGRDAHDQQEDDWNYESFHK
jgi:hypothetical protein